MRLLISKILLVAAQSADAGSSWHQPEANPIVATHGRFETRGLMIKSSMVGMTLWYEHKHPEHKRVWTYMNFALASATTGVVIHNVENR